jgi:hypothetical protein
MPHELQAMEVRGDCHLFAPVVVDIDNAALKVLM